MKLSKKETARENKRHTRAIGIIGLGENLIQMIQEDYSESRDVISTAMAYFEESDVNSKGVSSLVQIHASIHQRIKALANENAAQEEQNAQLMKDISALEWLVSIL